jgi:hypothetical protein
MIKYSLWNSLTYKTIFSPEDLIMLYFMVRIIASVILIFVKRFSANPDYQQFNSIFQTL